MIAEFGGTQVCKREENQVSDKVSSLIIEHKLIKMPQVQTLIHLAVLTTIATCL